MEQNKGKRNTATIELLKLAEKNPELPIITKIFGGVFEDYVSGWWMGEITGSCVETVWTGTFHGQYHTWTLDEALMDSETFVKENAPEDLKRELYKLGDADFKKETGEWIKSLPWKKCIIAYVDAPDRI